MVVKENVSVNAGVLGSVLGWFPMLSGYDYARVKSKVSMVDSDPGPGIGFEIGIDSVNEECRNGVEDYLVRVRVRVLPLLVVVQVEAVTVPPTQQDRHQIPRNRHQQNRYSQH